jgi:hypothetical protein
VRAALAEARKHLLGKLVNSWHYKIAKMRVAQMQEKKKCDTACGDFVSTVGRIEAAGAKQIVLTEMALASNKEQTDLARQAMTLFISREKTHHEKRGGSPVPLQHLEKMEKLEQENKEGRMAYASMADDFEEFHELHLVESERVVELEDENAALKNENAALKTPKTPQRQLAQRQLAQVNHNTPAATPGRKAPARRSTRSGAGQRAWQQ